MQQETHLAARREGRISTLSNELAHISVNTTGHEEATRSDLPNQEGPGTRRGTFLLFVKGERCKSGPLSGDVALHCYSIEAVCKRTYIFSCGWINEDSLHTFFIWTKKSSEWSSKEWAWDTHVAA